MTDLDNKTFVSVSATTTNTPHQFIIIAIEALEGSMATSRFMPLVQSFASKGVWTPMMRVPSSSPKINWKSIFYSLGPDRIGCDEEWCGIVSQVSMNTRSLIDIFEEDFGYNVALFSENKKTMTNILNRYVTKFSYTETGSFDNVHLPSLNNGQPRLVLLHYNGLQHIGEASGYGSTNYRAKIACFDKSIYKAVLELWADSPDNTTFLLVSNHGGVEFNSKKFAMTGIQVPFMMWGQNVTVRAHISGQVTETLQIGPTVLSIFGHQDDIPSEWIEVPIENINTNPTYANLSIFLPPRTGIKLDDYECHIPSSVPHSKIAFGQHLIIVIGVLFYTILLCSFSLSNIK